MITVLMILLGLVTVLLGFVILIQEPKQAGLSGAFGLGGTDQMMGTKATSGIGRFTAYLSVVFFLLCVSVGVLSSSDQESSRLKADPQDPAIGSTDPGSETPGIGGGDALGDAAPTDGTGAGTAPDVSTGSDAGDDAAGDDAAGDDAAGDDAAGDDAAGDDAPAETPAVAPAETPAETPAVAPAESSSSGDAGSGN